MRFACILALLLTFSISKAIHLPGTPPILNFTRDHFNGGSEIGSFFMDKRGLIYMNNSSGVLEFDGLDWRYLENTYEKTALAICPSSDTSAMVVFNNSLCKLFYSDNSFIQMDTILAGYDFKNSVHHFCFKHSLYFIKNNVLYSANELGVKLVQLDVMFAQGLNNTLIIQRSNLSCAITSSNSINIEYPLKESIVAALPGDTTFFITQTKMYRARSGQLKQLYNTDQQFKLTTLSSSGKHFYLGTRSHGLLILDKSSKLLKHVNIYDGILSGRINSVQSDKHGNIWVALNAGISYIKLTSPFYMVAKDVNLGHGNTCVVYNNIIYAGSKHGLFKIKQHENEYLIEKIQGIEEEVLKIELFSNYLIIKGISGYKVFNLGNNELKPINERNITISASDDILLKVRGSIIEVYESIKKLEKVEPKYSTILYYDTLNISNQKIIWHYNNHKLEGYRIGSDSIYPDSELTLENIQDILFTNYYPIIRKNNHYYQYEPDSLKLLPGLEKFIAEQGIEYARIDSDSTLWMIADHVPFRYSQSIKRIQGNSFFHQLRHQLSVNYNITQINDSLFFIGSDKGFICFNKQHKIRKHQFRTLIRSVKSRQKDLKINIKSSIDTRPFHYVYVETPIKYENNDISFYYSTGANEFEGASFRYSLLGYMPKWTGWQSENSREFTNLDPGDYVFAVQGQNISRENGHTALVYFTIAAPWYMQWWAFTIYALIIIMAFLMWAIIVKQREKRKNHEIQLKKEKEIIRLKNEKLNEDIIRKSQQLANTTMESIKKNKFLNEIKSDIESINTEQKHKVKNLIRKLDKEIEGQEAQQLFEFNFDKVHENFIKRLNEKHNNLTTKDVRLCAYIRMGLSSKEIAPLLNITYRGVELSRYRLRAKLGIQKGENMTIYIQNL